MVTHDSTVAARAQRVGQMRDGGLTFDTPAALGGHERPWPA